MSTREYFRLDSLRCMRAAVPMFTPTNNGTLALFNNSQAGEQLVVWLAYIWFLNLGEAGFGVFQGNPGGTAMPVRPLWTRQAVYSGVVTKLDTATVYTIDQSLPSGMTYLPTLQVDLPWAVLDPGWSFIIQSQATANQFAADVIWQSVPVLE